MKPLVFVFACAALPLSAQDKALSVSADGAGGYRTVQQAVDAAPPSGANISIAPGIYREVVVIAKPNVHLRGAGSDPGKAVIVFDKSAGSNGGTLHSATIEVRGDNFLAENFTIANDFNATHPQLQQGSQALALLATGDRAVFHNVRLLGNQDTLYSGSARQYFSDCYIEGNVDFIFGDGKVVFDRCEIHSTRHAGGYVTAQGKRYADQDSIFVFNHCKLTAEPGVARVWLGRPWRAYASVVFLNTEMDSHIERAGWREWHPGETHYLETVYYAEYNSSGPGAHPADRDPHMRRLDHASAARFEAKQILAAPDGWDPTADATKGISR